MFQMVTGESCQCIQRTGSQKYNHAWGLQQLREVWTKNFKSSAAAEDDVQEDDVEMTVEGRASSVGAPEDEDAFEKQMRQ